ncbi:MAG: M14 family metallopeptidase [Bacteroidia bacterium]
MNRFLPYCLLICVLLFFAGEKLQAQKLQSPEAYLGYTPGDRFAYHHEVINYVRHVAQASPKVDLFTYGKTYEGRDLVVTVISSEENLKSLEEMRESHLARVGLVEGDPSTPARPIVWLSYNVHGNEAACTEAALSTLHSLASAGGDTALWLDKVIVILDPCLNPDGRERYVSQYRQRAAPFGNANPDAWEHREPWPTGRFNHYLFDPNRDWCWQTQQESQQRLALFRQWMPHIHADFHEMGHNSSYFFAPAAKPYHEVITPWQRSFQEMVGEQHAGYFNEKNWRFFTGEVYDLFYPSYGDTWPMFSGAIGFTYEQGGSGKAGVCIHRGGGDTLFLAERIAHHLVTGFSTIEIAYLQRESLLQKQIDYFRKPLDYPPGPYRSFVVKAAEKPEAIRALTHLLDKQLIRYSFAQEGYGPRRLEGQDYDSRSLTSFKIAKGDLIVTTAQPQGRMVKVLFEPEAYLEDSITYDLTAWALPYVYGLKSYALTNLLEAGTGSMLKDSTVSASKRTYAFLVPWNDASHVHFLAEALQQGFRARYTTSECVVGEQQYPRGTLAFLVGENKGEFISCLEALARQHEVRLVSIAGGKMARGSDLGSENWQEVRMPKIALIAGNGTRATAVGELWYFFEQRLHYPVTILEKDQLESAWLTKYDLIILPDGNFTSYRKQLMSFVGNGGNVMAFEGATATFSLAKTALAAAIKYQKNQREKHPEDKIDNRRMAFSNRIAGSIYKISLDNEHVLGFGYEKALYMIKNNNHPLPLLLEDGSGANVGVLGSQAHMSGLTGDIAKERLRNSLAIGVESIGDGKIVYMTDSPIFRGFWRSGELFMGNVLFFL